ncbi:MAG TPA: hypothetical protein VLG39_03825 [Nitrospirota bacterium]|nr:hypothetical protein [Nitrospirota bacterium]
MNLSVRGKWFFGFGLILVFFSASAETLPPPSSEPTPTEQRGDPELQQKRLAFIKNAIGLGLISKIGDDSPITHVAAGKQFISLPFEEKEDILNVIWAYYKTEDPQKDIILVIDRNSGNIIGEYSLANGGLKMK